MDNSMEMKAMEDHKTWRRNARYLYDLLIDQASEWPMMSLEFLPDISRPEGKDYSTQRLLVGINGDNEDTKSYLEIIGVRVPNRNRSFTSIDFNQELREYGGFVKDPTRSYLAPSIRILYNGDVHRTRHLPQNPSVIAAKGSTNSVYIFDYTRHTSLPTASDEFKYEIELVGHKAGGFGLCWNTFKAGRLISGSDDGLICLWDVNGGESDLIGSISIFYLKDRDVNDVAWSRFDPRVFAAGDSTGVLSVWDVAQPDEALCVSAATTDQIISLSFNQYNPYALAIGSSSGQLHLFDLRNLSCSIHTINGHDGKEVRQVAWSPHDEAILASGACDNRVKLWNLRKVNTSDDLPELQFVHAGHYSPILDLTWSPNERGVVCSSEQNNYVQMWQPATANTNQFT